MHTNTLATVVYWIPRAPITTKRLTCFCLSSAVWGHIGAQSNKHNTLSMSLSGGIGRLSGRISVELVTDRCARTYTTIALTYTVLLTHITAVFKHTHIRTRSHSLTHSLTHSQSTSKIHPRAVRGCLYGLNNGARWRDIRNRHDLNNQSDMVGILSVTVRFMGAWMNECSDQ